MRGTAVRVDETAQGSKLATKKVLYGLTPYPGRYFANLKEKALYPQSYPQKIAELSTTKSKFSTAE